MSEQVAIPQVVIKPRCWECQSTDTVAVRTKGITGGISYRGKRCKASTQYRKCRECGNGFKVTVVKGPVAL